MWRAKIMSNINTFDICGFWVWFSRPYHCVLTDKFYILHTHYLLYMPGIGRLPNPCWPFWENDLSWRSMRMSLDDLHAHGLATTCTLQEIYSWEWICILMLINGTQWHYDHKNAWLKDVYRGRLPDPIGGWGREVFRGTHRVAPKGTEIGPWLRTLKRLNIESSYSYGGKEPLLHQLAERAGLKKSTWSI